MGISGFGNGEAAGAFLIYVGYWVGAGEWRGNAYWLESEWYDLG